MCMWPVWWGGDDDDERMGMRMRRMTMRMTPRPCTSCSASTPWKKFNFIFQEGNGATIITSMMVISINTNLRWVDVISRAGHRTGEHEGGDSLQLPGLELSVKIIIIVLRRSTIIDFCHQDNDKGFVNKNEEENHHHLYRRGIIIMNMI